MSQPFVRVGIEAKKDLIRRVGVEPSCAEWSYWF
jgi:hypothetical protein